MTGVYERTKATTWVTQAEIDAHPWAFRCPVDGCFYGVCAATQEEAEREQWTHGCPREGGKMIGKSIIEKAWEQLDGETDRIYALMAEGEENGTPEEGRVWQNKMNVAQAAARGKAEILALLLHPQYEDAAAIARAAKERWMARQP